MRNAIEWVRDHPWLSGSLVLLLVVLFIVIRRHMSGGGGEQQQIVQGGPSEALQAANLQAGVQSQGIQAAADAKNNELQAQLAALQLQVGGAITLGQQQQQVELQKTLTAGDVASQSSSDQLAAAIASIGGQVSIAQGGYDRDIAVTGIQAGVQMHGYDTQLAMQKDIDFTSLGIATVQADRDVALGGQGVDIARINAGAAVDITRLQTDVQNNYIDTAGEVAIHGQDWAGTLGLTQIGASYDLQKQNQTEYWKSIFANDRWGSGENQVSALNIIRGGSPAIGVSAQQGQAQSNVADSTAAASLGASASNVFSSIFGAAA